MTLTAYIGPEGLLVVRMVMLTFFGAVFLMSRDQAPRIAVACGIVYVLLDMTDTL